MVLGSLGSLFFFDCFQKNKRNGTAVKNSCEEVFMNLELLKPPTGSPPSGSGCPRVGDGGSQAQSPSGPDPNMEEQHLLGAGD